MTQFPTCRTCQHFITKPSTNGLGECAKIGYRANDDVDTLVYYSLGFDCSEDCNITVDELFGCVMHEPQA